MYLNRESLSQILKSYQNQQFIAFLSFSKAKADSKVDVHPTPHKYGLMNNFHMEHSAQWTSSLLQRGFI